MTEAIIGAWRASASGELPRLLPLVGRADELSELETLMLDTGSAPRVVFVRGEGGVGKSRIVAELAERAGRRSWEVVRGRAYPVETGMPYALFADAWVPLLKGLEPSALTVLTRGGESELRYLFPALGDGHDGRGHPVAGEPDEFRTQLMWNFAEFVKRLAGRTPLLCVLEDLHWSDESSLELLHFLARQVAGLPVMIVCTYNDQERDGSRALIQTERSLESIRAAHIVRLEPLSRDQVTELVSRTFVVDVDIVRDFAGVLFGWTRGNAFFVEEILKGMVASGRLRRESGTWIGWDAKEFGMPASIRDAVMIRVAGLPEVTRKVVEMAAIVGNRVSFGVLESVSSLDASAALSAVEELCAAGLFNETASGSEIVYDFRHPLARQTLYDEFGLQRAKILHGIVAEAMETYYGDDAVEHADELAYHFARTDGGRMREKATRYLVAAGRRALERHADQEAAAYLQSALERVGNGESEAATEQQRVIVPLLARALTRLGNFDAAARLWTGVLERIPDGHPERANVQRALGMTNVWRGRHAEADKAFEAGLRIAETQKDDNALVRLLVARAHGLHEIGKGAEALEVLERALPVAEAIGDERLLARVHRALALLHVWVGPPEEAIVHGERAIELADAVGDLSVGFWARWSLAVLYGMRGDTARMMRGVEEINEMADRYRSPVLRLWTADMVVEHDFATGEWDAGLARGEKAIALARSLNQRTLLPRLLVWTSQFHLGRGDMEKAEELTREAGEIAGLGSDDATVDVHQVVPAYIGLAHYMVYLGDFDQAIEAAKKGLEIAEGTGYTLWAMHQLLPILGEACLWAGRFDEAGLVGRRMREHAERIDHRLGRIWADACDALVQWKRGDPEGSVAGMLEAADALEAIPMIWPATRLRRQLAGRLFEIGRIEEGDRQLRKVHAECVRLNAGLELEKTRKMFIEADLRAPLVPNSDLPLGLTEAELRVAVLVARGMSNGKIGATLGCSTGTVRTHLQNIYKKLDIGGTGARYRLAELVRAEGLLDD